MFEKRLLKKEETHSLKSKVDDLSHRDVTIGDFDGKAGVLLDILVNLGILEVEKKQLKRLIEIFTTPVHAIEKNQAKALIEECKSILDKEVTIGNRPKLLRILSDKFSSSENDNHFFVLMLYKACIQKKIKLSIVISEHTAYFLAAKEAGNEKKSVFSIPKIFPKKIPKNELRSFDNFKRLLDFKVISKKLLTDVQKNYFKNLILVDFNMYHMEEKNRTILYSNHQINISKLQSLPNKDFAIFYYSTDQKPYTFEFGYPVETNLSEKSKYGRFRHYISFMTITDQYEGLSIINGIVQNAIKKGMFYNLMKEKESAAYNVIFGGNIEKNKSDFGLVQHHDHEVAYCNNDKSLLITESSERKLETKVDIAQIKIVDAGISEVGVYHTFAGVNCKVKPKTVRTGWLKLPDFGMKLTQVKQPNIRTVSKYQEEVSTAIQPDKSVLEKRGNFIQETQENENDVAFCDLGSSDESELDSVTDILNSSADDESYLMPALVDREVGYSEPRSLSMGYESKLFDKVTGYPTEIITVTQLTDLDETKESSKSEDNYVSIDLDREHDTEGLIDTQNHNTVELINEDLPIITVAQLTDSDETKEISKRKGNYSFSDRSFDPDQEGLIDTRNSNTEESLAAVHSDHCDTEELDKVIEDCKENIQGMAAPLAESAREGAHEDEIEQVMLEHQKFLSQYDSFCKRQKEEAEKYRLRQAADAAERRATQRDNKEKLAAKRAKNAAELRQYGRDFEESIRPCEYADENQVYIKVRPLRFFLSWNSDEMSLPTKKRIRREAAEDKENRDNFHNRHAKDENPVPSRDKSSAPTFFQSRGNKSKADGLTPGEQQNHQTKGLTQTRYNLRPRLVHNNQSEQIAEEKPREQNYATKN